MNLKEKLAMEAEVFKEVNINSSEDNVKSVVFRMLRDSEGLHIFVKSPEFQRFFKGLANNRLNNSISQGWGVEMGAYDLNSVVSDQIFDNTMINDYSEPAGFVPQTLRIALSYWNVGDGGFSDQVLINDTSNGGGINYNYADPNNESYDEDGNPITTPQERIGWAVPNLSYLLSDKLKDGIKIKFTVPMSNRTFDLYFRMVQEYFKFINEVIQPRTNAFALSTCSNSIPKMDIDGTLKMYSPNETLEL